MSTAPLLSYNLLLQLGVGKACRCVRVCLYGMSCLYAMCVSACMQCVACMRCACLPVCNLMQVCACLPVCIVCMQFSHKAGKHLLPGLLLLAAMREVYNTTINSTFYCFTAKLTHETPQSSTYFTAKQTRETSVHTS